MAFIWNINIFNLTDRRNENYVYSDTGRSNETIEKITPAPSKFKLKMFGGDLSIDEYRSSFNEQVTFDITLPPIIPISHNDITIGGTGIVTTIVIGIIITTAHLGGERKIIILTLESESNLEQIQR